MEGNIDTSLINVPLLGRRFVATTLVSILLAYLPLTSSRANEPSKDDQADVPAWLFPLNPAASNSPSYDAVRRWHVLNSQVSFTQAELNDLFNAPDWHPISHGSMPPLVAHGHPPDVYACGYCHTAGGQGRPENAALAGLPAAYIMNQLADFKSGERKSASRGAYRPADRMIETVKHASTEELSAAADYFAAQPLHPRVLVLERASVPRSRVIGWVYAADERGGVERLGQRLLEFAPDETRHENRDDGMRYIAYAPPGSIDRGRHISQAGFDSSVNACNSCHGPTLRGVGLIPPIAGRSPTYILRQLVAFRTGARSAATGLPMRNVVKNLQINGMIDVAAYAASLPP